jgi:hypothetical protein
MATAPDPRRTAFEAWHKSKYPTTSLARSQLKNGTLGAYLNSSVTMRWNGWEGSVNVPQPYSTGKQAKYLLLMPQEDGRSVIPAFCSDAAAVKAIMKLETGFIPADTPEANKVLDEMVSDLMAKGICTFDEGPPVYCYPLAENKGTWWTK